jgi:hypothetical protein
VKRDLGQLVIDGDLSHVYLDFGTWRELGCPGTFWAGRAWVFESNDPAISNVQILTEARALQLWDNQHAHQALIANFHDRVADLIGARAKSLGASTAIGRRCTSCNEKSGICSRHFPRLIELRLSLRIKDMLGTQSFARSVDRLALDDHFEESFMDAIIEITTRHSSSAVLDIGFARVLREKPSCPREAAKLLGVEANELEKLLDVLVRTPSLDALSPTRDVRQTKALVMLAGWLRARGDGRSKTIQASTVDLGLLRAGTISGLRWAPDLLLLASVLGVRRTRAAASELPRRYRADIELMECLSGSRNFARANSRSEAMLNAALAHESRVVDSLQPLGFPWEHELSLLCLHDWRSMSYAQRLDHLGHSHMMTLGRRSKEDHDDE